MSKLDHRTLVLWATDCTEHVLLYFEGKYPKDDRPQKAIEAKQGVPG
ncbi:putative immunity protein [Thermaerobacillus caldiproteolyticus]